MKNLFISGNCNLCSFKHLVDKTIIEITSILDLCNAINPLYKPNSINRNENITATHEYDVIGSSFGGGPTEINKYIIKVLQQLKSSALKDFSSTLQAFSVLAIQAPCPSPSRKL